MLPNFLLGKFTGKECRKHETFCSFTKFSNISCHLKQNVSGIVCNIYLCHYISEFLAPMM